MGNQIVSSFEESLWLPINTSGCRVILQNQQTLKCVEKYYTTIEQGLLDKPLDTYQWRSKLQPQLHVVEIYEYGGKQGSSCDNIDEYYIITQRIHRLGEIPKFSKPQGFLIIKQTLIALSFLKNKYGLFSPNLMNIGINQKGITKIWIDQNFAQNNLTENNINKAHRQQIIVNNLCRIISDRVYNNTIKYDYPINYNFERSIAYIDSILQSDKLYKIDKVYIHREKFFSFLKKNQQEEQFSRTRSNQQYSQLSAFSQDVKANQFDKNYSNSKLSQLRSLPHSNIPTNRNQNNRLFVIQQQSFRRSQASQRNKIPSIFGITKFQPHVEYQQHLPSPRLNQNQQSYQKHRNYQPFKIHQFQQHPKPQYLDQKISRFQTQQVQPQSQPLEHHQPLPSVVHKQSLSPPLSSIVQVSAKLKNSSRSNQIGVSIKSQIKMKNDLEQVDSVILMDDEILEERDKVIVDY